jgi:hypothetical protein
MKSECSELQNKIAALLLGDLADDEKKTLEAHLATCSHCRSEQDNYLRTIQQMALAGDEDIPHHFFIYPEKRSDNPWQLFLGMRRPWQAAAAGITALILLLGIAAISRLQIRSGNGDWAIIFGRNDVDLAALKSEILEAAEKKNQESRIAWIQEMRGEIENSHTFLTEQQRDQLRAALALMDSRMNGRISGSEGHVREETQQLVADLYRVVSHKQAQDIESINLRLDSTDAKNAIKTRQTNEILGTLLQVADLRLRSTP